MGFEPGPSSARAFVLMHYATPRARKGEAFLLGCQNVQIIKTPMMLVPGMGRRSHIEDDPEAPVIHLCFCLTGTVLWVTDFKPMKYSSQLCLTESLALC